MAETTPADFGSATITPADPVAAGNWGTWTIHYRVPEFGIDDGGSIRVAFRFVSDWCTPQTERPEDDHYARVTCSREETRLVTSWRARANVRPYQPHLFIEVLDAPLEHGDEVTITYGDTSGGGRGTRAQTFCQERFDFQISVDRYGTGLYDMVPNPPLLEIVPNRPHKLVVFASGDGTSTHPARVLVRAEDVWGNPVRKDLPEPVQLEATGPASNLPGEVLLKNGQCLLNGLEFSGPGVWRVAAQHPWLGRAEGPPLSIVKGETEYHHFFGDLHGQSGETVGTNDARTYFLFARDRSLCDFAGHQGNDFQVTDAFWDELNRLTAELTEQGRFVAFPGYEWSGLSPIGGDRNIFFLEEGQTIRRSSTLQVQGLAAQDVDYSPLTKLYEALHESGEECLLVPHIGGRRANLDFFDPDLEPVVEVHSSWGTFEWFYHDALQRGYRVGVVSNSDGHKCRPGAAHAGAGKFGCYGGLTCLLAEAFSRPAMFQALKSRRCYGTSGPRILVDARLDGLVVGSDLGSAEKRHDLRVKVLGTAGIERIDLLAAGQPVLSWEAESYGARPRNVVRIRWSGARILNRNRATRWDGSLEVKENRPVDVEGFAFDSPAEGIQEWKANSVSWKSITTGDEDGLLLELEEEGAGFIEFKTGPAECLVSVKDLEDGPVTLEAGGIEQRVVFELAPSENLPREVEWVTEIEPEPTQAVNGAIPYHLRIVQTDGHRAWTSPWFIEV